MKKLMKFVTALAAAASLMGCSDETLQEADGPKMEYQDQDYQTEYAKILDFESEEGVPYFAVAFLGYGEDKTANADDYTERLFGRLAEQLSDEMEQVLFEGDEWYLVIPRYKDDVIITNLETNEKQIIYHGTPFMIKCNLSDIYSNVEIGVEIQGGHKFSPQLDGIGRLVPSDAVWDITEYQE